MTLTHTLTLTLTHTLTLTLTLTLTDSGLSACLHLVVQARSDLSRVDSVSLGVAHTSL